MKKLYPLILVVIMITTLLAGCGTPAAPAPAPTQASAPTPAPAPTQAPVAAAKDTLTVMAAIPAETMDPTTGKMGDQLVWHSMFDTLLNYDDKGGVRPNLAESWTKSDDGLTYTFKLRKDIKFHDGSKFTADDVIYTFDTTMKLPMYQQFYQRYTKWEKVDDYTVKFTAASPSADVPATLALMGFIVPKAAHSADPAAFEAKPVGSGPFKFVSRGADGTVTTEAFADYFGGKPAFAKLVIKPPVEPSTAVVALQNGEVDLVTSIPPAQIPLIEEDKNLELVQMSGWSFFVLAMMGQELRDDPNLRKAIYHGIDRQKLVDVANEGVGQAATDVFNTKVLGAAAGTVKDYVGYDEAMAKDFLSKSNYKPGTELTITIMPPDAAMAQSIQDDLKKIGIAVKIEQLDVNGWSDKIMKGTAQMTTVQFGGTGESSPDSLLAVFSKTYPYLGKDMYTTQEYEDLVAQIKAEPNADKRSELAKKAVQLQYDFANVVNLYDAVMNFAHSKSVTNIDPMSAATSIYYLGDFKPAK